MSLNLGWPGYLAVPVYIYKNNFRRVLKTISLKLNFVLIWCYSNLKLFKISPDQNRLNLYYFLQERINVSFKRYVLILFIFLFLIIWKMSVDILSVVNIVDISCWCPHPHVPVSVTHSHITAGAELELPPHKHCQCPQLSILRSLSCFFRILTQATFLIQILKLSLIGMDQEKDVTKL